MKTKASYRRDHKHVSHFFDHPPAAGSALEAEFELLMMVERFEAKHFFVNPPDPAAAIGFAIEQCGLSSAAIVIL